MDSAIRTFNALVLKYVHIDLLSGFALMEGSDEQPITGFPWHTARERLSARCMAIWALSRVLLLSNGDIPLAPDCLVRVATCHLLHPSAGATWPLGQTTTRLLRYLYLAKLRSLENRSA